MSCPLGEAVHVAPSGHYHLVIDDDPIFETDLFWYCIRLVVVISSLFYIFEKLRSISIDDFPRIFHNIFIFAQVKQLQELLELKQVKLNRCTAELQALGSGRRVSIRHIALDPIFQALQKFQSTSMTSSSPLALGGFLSNGFFLSRVFFWNFPQVTSHADLNNPGF